MLTLLAFLAGVVSLTLGANWLVQGASAIAEIFRVPKHVAGLTLVALGTSAPELFVNLIAAFHGETEFALSNVSGSNLANLCIGFGICAVFASIPLRRTEFGVDLMMLWIIPLIVVIMCYSSRDHVLPWVTAGPLTVLLVYYLWTLKNRPNDVDENLPIEASLKLGLIHFVGGIVALYMGGEWVLHAARAAAGALGIGEDVIGLTVVAVCTSVPDITASVVASLRKEHGIAVGNILGSNISNLVLVLNGTILVSGQALPTNAALRGDYLAVTFVSVLVFAAGWCFAEVPKRLGWFLFGAYIVYIGMRVINA